MESKLQLLHLVSSFLESAINSLERQNRQLASTLKEVEWVHTGSGGMECPWCHGLYPDHRPDCRRQGILRDVEEGHSES